MSAISEPAISEILCERLGCAGVVTLNRPAVLNALTLGMVRGLAKALDEWEHDPAITRIIIEGAGEKAFCAGGDIRQLYDLGQAGHQEEAIAFWREEYILNARIKNYPKSYIALIDGIVMGGGVGVSLHGSHVVAGERFMFAMPEVGIGFFPDVGASHILPRLTGRYGSFIALTGERVRQADAVMLGLATIAIASRRMKELKLALVAGADIAATLTSYAMTPETGPLQAEHAVIERCFAGETIPDMLGRLDEASTHGSAFAAKLAATMRARSPMSMAIAHEQMKRGGTISFAEAMQMEFRIVSRICHGHDFYEGVRAVLIDKDNAPKWQPATIEAVSAQAVAAHFESLGDDDLKLEA